MVFTFEHVDLDVRAGRRQVGPRAPCRCRRSSATSRRGRWASPTSAGTRSTGTTTTSPGPCRGSATTAPSTGSARPRPSATVLHLHRGTPYVYQGEELGMTNAPFDAIGDYRDIESLNYHAQRARAGVARRDRDAVAGGQEPRQRAHADAVGRRAARRLHAPASPGCPSTRTTPTINAAAAAGGPALGLHHYRALIALRHDHPLVVDGRFELLLPDHEQLWVISRGEADHRLLVVANVSSRPARLDAGSLPDLSGARVLLSTHPDRDAMVGDDAQLLLPWESRVVELGP